MSDNNCVTNMCQYFGPKSRTKSPKNSRTNRAKGNERENGFAFKRKPILMKTFNRFEEQMSEVRDRLFAPLMQSLFTFVSDNSLTNKMRENSFKTEFTANSGLIPTVLLSIGMNSSEHKSVCDLLIQTIQDLTSFVVYLNSRQTQNISSVFKTIRESILTEEVMECSDLDENRAKSLTFADIFKIYEEYVINKNENNFCPPIVLFLDEIESFDHSLVTTLVLIIKEYMQTIPFLLIMSQSNQTTSLQHLLPSSATDFLLIHHFNSFPANRVIDQIVNQLLIESSLPFKLGPKVLDFIIKMFQKFDFSIQSTKHIIKYAVFQHFYRNDLSLICQSISKLKTYLKNIDSSELQVLRHSSLFDTSLNDKEFKKNIVKKVSEFMSIHNQFVTNLKILLKLLETNDKNINLVELYVNALNQSYDYKPIIDSLHRLSQNQWKASFDNCLTDSSLNRESEPLIPVLKSRRKALNELIDSSKSEPQVLIERIEVSELKNKLSNLKTRHQWKETINPLNKPKVMTKFENWRKMTIDCIEVVLSKEVTNPMACALSELIFFDDLNSLKGHILTDQRNSIHKSLTNSWLKSDQTFESINENESKSDFQRLFILYNESQSMVNMYDWFMAFKDLNQQSEPLAKKSKKRKIENKNDESIVRFLNAVSDFEYMGLIQSAKRKTDHLMRLVWF